MTLVQMLKSGEGTGGMKVVSSPLKTSSTIISSWRLDSRDTHGLGATIGKGKVRSNSGWIEVCVAFRGINSFSKLAANIVIPMLQTTAYCSLTLNLSKLGGRKDSTLIKDGCNIKRFMRLWNRLGGKEMMVLGCIK